eukprot:scaffold157_cov255-Prasinococcus_capsulatus_cf.AAC.4
MSSVSSARASGICRHGGVRRACAAAAAAAAVVVGRGAAHLNGEAAPVEVVLKGELDLVRDHHRDAPRHHRLRRAPRSAAREGEGKAGMHSRAALVAAASNTW